MASVFDVAGYILRKKGLMTAWKLQKLVYYSQAWSLVWDDRPLFRARIEAWTNGPVAPTLYREHRGNFKVRKIDKGNPNNLDQDARETVDVVLEYYGDKSPQWLSDLTHMEEPWRRARMGVPEEARSGNEITHASMAEYYGGLLPEV